jgi:uncharacterized protein (TIGR02246 family)
MSKPPPNDEQEVRELYRRLLDGWNRRDAAAMAALFTENGNVVGFDGSQLNGPGEIAAVLGKIFAEHQTPPFVDIVREVRSLSPDVALLRATVGMAPPGQAELNPALNAIQSLVAARRGGQWRIELFQNTPAAFHGRPEEVQRLTDELRRVSLSRS